MTLILKYRTPDGEIAIETDEPVTKATGFAPAARHGDDNERVMSEDLDQALAPIKAAANALARTMAATEGAPSSAALELGLRFTSESGLVFAKPGAAAQMKLSLTWKATDGKDD